MKRVIREIFLLPIYLYRAIISPLLGSNKCRYTPSCSEYFIKAVKMHGIIKGFILGITRIFRCSSLFLGGVDDVPEVYTFKSVIDNFTIYKKPKDY